jgi:hypothetical protein
MSERDLPAQPDFDALEAGAAAGAAERGRLMTSIGALSIAWSNCESVLIYLLMVLLRTDDVSAALVYGTLNTARARADLVSRLAQVRVSDAELLAEIEDVLKELERCGRLRNDLQHASYAFDAEGRPVATRSMRVEKGRGGLRFGRERTIDEARFGKIAETIDRLAAVNRRLWDLLPTLRAHVSGPVAAYPPRKD